MTQRAWVRWARVAWGSLLALALVGLTYVLFDPDLGTTAPLFGELTCRGELEVEVASGFHEANLTTPASGVYYRVSTDDVPLPVLVTLYVREGPDDLWELLLRRDDEDGEGYMSLPSVTDRTEAYVAARDLAGRVCPGESRVIAAAVA